LVPFDDKQVVQALQRFVGERAYLHFEFCRGGFVRNAVVEVEDAQVRGEGPWRVALRCGTHGWVIMEGLTHMEIRPGAPLFLGALESDQRLSQALQISREPFAP
jgi:hypothetical protein